MRFWLSVLTCFYSSLSLAQQAVEIQTTRVTQHGFGDPSITFKPNVTGNLNVDIDCGPKSYSLNRAISPGVDETITFDGLSVGTYSCAGSVQLTAADGSVGEMPLTLDVQLLEPLKLSVDPTQLDLASKSLTLQATRPLERVKIELRGFTHSGAPASAGASNPLSDLGTTETSVTGLTEAAVQWTQMDEADEILQLVVTGWDQQNFPGQVILSPWSYAIPHEDVIFDTGSANIGSHEEPKLQAAYSELQTVLEKYGDVVIVQLYVAGYTDTVGSPSANTLLSANRAASIASWFKAAGFNGEVFYQGFGETALAVPTADETPEARNRRAVYILAASTPKVSEEIPATAWTPLR